jgi:TonB family protein
MWATVKVLIGPDGSVQNAMIYRSSGNTALDNAAVTAAKAATYSPKVVNCQPAAGVYLLRLPLDASP